MRAANLGGTMKRRGKRAGALTGIIIFVLVICALAIGIKAAYNRKARAARQEILAQICAEQVVAAYLSSQGERDKLFEAKEIKPRIVGEEFKRAALAKTRLKEDTRDSGGPLSFATYENFRSTRIRKGTYQLKSHVTWPDPATSGRKWTLSYNCRAARMGDSDAWNVDNIQLEGIPIDDSWTVLCSDVQLQRAEGTWEVTAGKLTLRIADHSRPVTQVDLASPSGS